MARCPNRVLFFFNGLKQIRLEQSRVTNQFNKILLSPRKYNSKLNISKYKNILNALTKLNKVLKLIQ